MHLPVADLRGDFASFRSPDAAVVAERFRHQRELGLIFAGDGDAGWVDLRVAGVGEEGSAFGGAPGGGDVAAHCVGGEEKDVAVAAGGENHCIGGVALDFPGVEVADDDALGVATDFHEIEHLGAAEHFHAAFVDLLFKCLVAADKELLSGLAAGVEGAGDLGSTERAVVQQAAVLAGEGHALGHALVDNVVGNLGEAIDVRLAGAEVAALDRVVEKAENRVAIVAVVFRGVDPALSGDRVGAAR